MTITRRGALTGITMRGGLGTLARFAVDWSRVETVITPGDTEEQTIDDAVFEVTTPATVDYEAQAIVRPTHPDADVSQITWSTSDPSIATIDSDGRVTRVSDGYIRIIATDQHGATAKSGLVHIYRQSGVESQTFLAWVEGSLAKAAADAIDNRIADADPQTDMAIFTTQDHGTATYVRNPDCWAADLDLTGISPYSSRNGQYGGGVMISPRDMLASEHWPRFRVGDTVRFVDGDGDAVDMTVDAVKDVGPANSSDGYATDYQVVTFDQDVPSDIKHYPVLPANWGDYIRHLSIGLPTFGTCQHEDAVVQDLIGLGTFATHKVPTDAQRLAFYKTKIEFDSNKPGMLVPDDEPVLDTLWTFGGAGSGPNIARLHDLINAAMTANGSPYQLAVADLSGWTNYAEPVYPPGRNMLLNTEDFTQAPWTRFQGMTVLADQGIAPNGTMTADLLVASQTASRIGGQTNTLDQGERVTASVYVKYVDQDRIAIRLWSGTASPNDLIYARYRFSDDSFPNVTGSGPNRLTTSEPVGNGWVRIIASCDVHDTSGFSYLVYGGDATTDTYGETLAWGAQLEKGPVTPYEPRGAA